MKKLYIIGFLLMMSGFVSYSTTSAAGNARNFYF